jgi:hypothetical protein
MSEMDQSSTEKPTTTIKTAESELTLELPTTFNAQICIQTLEQNRSLESTTYPRKRGRKPIYATDEERHAAKLRQTKESNLRMKEKRRQLETQMLPLQHTLIKIMKNNIMDIDALEIIQFAINYFNGTY